MPPDPTPSPHLLSEAQRTVSLARYTVCKACPENAGLTAYTVRCKGCGCAGLSLVSGVCKLGKWTP